MGEEIYYVPVATAHGAHACAGLPMQIPQERACHSPDMTHQPHKARAGGPNETTAQQQMRDASRTDTPVQCACVRNDSETIRCDHSEIVRMLDLTPSLQYNAIAALSPRTSAACAPSNGDESRWVKRYIMCPWPLAHGAHTCAGLPMQIPPGQTQQRSTPIIRTPWESHLRSRTDKDGK